MSTWKIFSDTGNNFRWEISDQHFRGNPEKEPNDVMVPDPAPTRRLPSMADLLLQECSKLVENHGGNVDNPPMFRTGLGRSVSVKQSSLSKALSILGDEENNATGHFSKSMFQTSSEKIIDTSYSMFQTGSGKAVNISSAGLHRAKKLLGLQENSDNHTSKKPNAEELCGWQSSVPISSSNFQSISFGNEPKEGPPDILFSAPKPSPIKFHTAGGRSLSVSSDALQRARSLLGDPELGTFLDEGNPGDSGISFFEERKSNGDSLQIGDGFKTPLSQKHMNNRNHMSTNFISPLRSSSNRKISIMKLANITSGSNLMKEFDEAIYYNYNRLQNDLPPGGKPLGNRDHAAVQDSSENGIISSGGGSSRGPLADVSNHIDLVSANKNQIFGEKRKLGNLNSISPFKKPRSSKFTNPVNSQLSLVPTGSAMLASEGSHSKGRVSTRYPLKAPRKYIKEYFGVSPFQQNMFEILPDFIIRMNPDNAEKHKFLDKSGLDSIGPDDFWNMLAESGASMQYISKEWALNHYKWIVWKLACYERCYPVKSSGKLLTVPNVLEELKYRYEREVNCGLRSAIKKILEGDAPPSSMMVLCISSVHLSCGTKIDKHCPSPNGAENIAKVQLTDGWYSVNAVLDKLLLKMLVTRKLFVGQKIRIWGAGLCGWVGPVSPLEASGAVNLMLHINGTYRAHWADRLGFCKSAAPLAFRCIKGNGGAVPSTLVGITRIYPVLYRQRLSSGGSVVRSDRMETQMVELYNQRRAMVAEGITSEFQGNKDLRICNDYDNEEGAKILKMLETAAEPEVLMAEMSSEQLASFATYQAKIEAIKQSNMQKTIDKALEDAGLGARDITPFIRVRVVGLSSKCTLGKNCRQRGLITIWNPTEKQKSELVEGQAYVISGLVPLSADHDMLYLQARGCTTKWLPLSPSAVEQFEPFFTPRTSVSLSNLGKVPLSSEFDIAAFVVFVGEVYAVAHQKKQWVFVTDGSISELHPKEPSNSFLAISFSLPYVDCDSFVPINSNLTGSTVESGEHSIVSWLNLNFFAKVGFCNLIKRSRDDKNHLWVAEATENSAYFLSYDHAHCSHLKEASASVTKWAKTSSSKIEILRGKIVSVIGNCEG